MLLLQNSFNITKGNACLVLLQHIKMQETLTWNNNDETDNEIADDDGLIFSCKTVIFVVVVVAERSK